MAVGTGFANLFLGVAASKLEPAERRKFMANTMILTRMGHTGLGLLLLSGFYLITPYWKILGEMPLLIAKLSLVGLQVIMVSVLTVLAKRAQRQGNPAALMKLSRLAYSSSLSALPS